MKYRVSNNKHSNLHPMNTVEKHSTHVKFIKYIFRLFIQTLLIQLCYCSNFASCRLNELFIVAGLNQDGVGSWTLVPRIGQLGQKSSKSPTRNGRLFIIGRELGLSAN